MMDEKIVLLHNNFRMKKIVNHIRDFILGLIFIAVGIAVLIAAWKTSRAIGMPIATPIDKVFFGAGAILFFIGIVFLGNVFLKDKKKEDDPASSK